MLRRRALAWIALPGLLAGGCGFELRRAQKLPFRSIALVGFRQGSPLADDLRRALLESGAVIAPPAQAEVQLHALADAAQRSVVASTTSGQVRELQLRVRLRFDLRNTAGAELLAPVDLGLARDLSYIESAALAKAQEEAQLYQDMRADIVAQVLLRLATVRR